MRHLRYVALMTCVLLAACGPSENKLSALGRAQQIQESAPVKAYAQVVINAPVERVWRLLAAIPDWPHWQHDVSSATLDGPFKEGTTFNWVTGGNEIHSRLVLIKPDSVVAWTGRASVAKAVHVLKLTAVDSGTTIVQSNESMDGFMLPWFYSSADLQSSEETLLKSLKVAAESDPARGPQHQ